VASSWILFFSNECCLFYFKGTLKGGLYLSVLSAPILLVRTEI